MIHKPRLQIILTNMRSWLRTVLAFIFIIPILITAAITHYIIYHKATEKPHIFDTLGDVVMFNFR